MHQILQMVGVGVALVISIILTVINAKLGGFLGLFLNLIVMARIMWIYIKLGKSIDELR